MTATLYNHQQDYSPCSYRNGSVDCQNRAQDLGKAVQEQEWSRTNES